jgi:hypothetical protein
MRRSADQHCGRVERAERRVGARLSSRLRVMGGLAVVVGSDAISPPVCLCGFPGTRLDHSFSSGGTIERLPVPCCR